MNKRLILTIKIVVMAAVIVLLGNELRKAWGNVGNKNVAIDWRWGGIAVLGFCGSMLTSGWMWRWIAARMGERDGKRKLPTLPLLGAYTFSQMGKYIPGKVGLLLMRIERSGRVGMSAATCTLSTILENLLYMVSGGLAGIVAVVRVLGELRLQGKISAQQQMWMWPLIVSAIVLLGAACAPPVFYGLVNRLLRKLKKPEVAKSDQLSLGALLAALLGFVPCWFCGGLAMWGAARCVTDLTGTAIGWFAGAYALSVIIGMASLFPGGLVVREGILGAALAIQLSPALGQDEAIRLATFAVALQRVFQIIAEVLLGVAGGLATRMGPPGALEAAEEKSEASSGA